MVRSQHFQYRNFTSATAIFRRDSDDTSVASKMTANGPSLLTDRPRPELCFEP
jgi:hypothetical protein